jgi:hypothetical protein
MADTHRIREVEVVVDDVPAVESGSLVEGDILLLRANSGPTACMLSLWQLSCCCSVGLLPACAPVASHAGILLVIDGKRWLCEAVRYAEVPTSKQLTLTGRPHARTGVSASDVQATLECGYYSHAVAIRPEPPLSEGELELLRARFVALYGAPYSTEGPCRLLGLLELVNSVVNCPCACETSNSWACGELVAELLMAPRRQQPPLAEAPDRLPREQGSAARYLPLELAMGMRHSVIGTVGGLKNTLVR